MTKVTKKATFFILVIQHVFAMFGATVLVPILVGIPVSLALLSAGLGTLAFHALTKGKIPSFLGSSLVFVSPILLVLETHSLGYLKGGIICTGLLYLFYALLAKILGVKRIHSWFPPIVVGPLLISIGLKLVPTALKMCGYIPGAMNYQSLFLATVTIIILVMLSMVQHSFFRMMPILFAIFGAYLIALFLGLVDLNIVQQAQWFGLGKEAMNLLLTPPKFSWNTIFLLAPLSLVILTEHIDDIEHSGAVTGNNFMVDPGLHRTLLGDGVATIMAGFLGGPGNVTYSENTSVLAVTKNYDPSILRGAAIVAICMAFLGKLVAIIQSLPAAITGAVSLILLGLIVVVGLNVLVETKLDLHTFRNMTIPALVIVIGTFISEVKITSSVVIPGSFLAMFVGVAMNQIFLYEDKKYSQQIEDSRRS